MQFRRAMRGGRYRTEALQGPLASQIERELSPAAQIVLDAVAPRHIPWWKRLLRWYFLTPTVIPWKRLANALKPYFGENIRDAIRILRAWRPGK
jgi:hypothetical protein